MYDQRGSFNPEPVAVVSAAAEWNQISGTTSVWALSKRTRRRLSRRRLSKVDLESFYGCFSLLFLRFRGSFLHAGNL